MIKFIKKQITKFKKWNFERKVAKQLNTKEGRSLLANAMIEPIKMMKPSIEKNIRNESV